MSSLALQWEPFSSVDMHLKTKLAVCLVFITQHAQRERGNVIGCGVHIYIYMFVNEKNI